MNISHSNKNLLEKSQRFCFRIFDGIYPLDLKDFKSHKLKLKTEICYAKPDRINYYIFIIGKNKFAPMMVVLI
jgi:hypothetical protein